MKNSPLITALLFLVLSACESTTESTVTVKTDARDYVLAGSVGTELVYLLTRTDIDTNGIKKVSPSDTMFLTIVARDSAHPVGGLSVVVQERFVRAGASTPYGGGTSFYSSASHGIRYYKDYLDNDARTLLKNPLNAGAEWIDTSVKSGAMKKFTIQSVGETISTTFGQFTGIRTLTQGSAMINTVLYSEKTTYYYAPEVLLARREEIVENTYPSTKKDTRTTITDLIRYTKK